jgi:FAD/FMN-containing dehydrogenase
MTDFTELAIAGRIATPNDADWDQARMGWNLVADQRPDAVAVVENGDDITAVVRFSAQNGLRVSGQGTGHGAVALGSLEGAILIKTERMRGVEIDAGARTARVEAGVLSVELAEAAQQHGLSALPGSSPDVGVTGFHLGGGLSWFGRQYGFACNRVRAIELVTADGEARTVDTDNEPDLFWALRGGGGDYALVVALHIDLVPVADAYAGAFLFPGAVGAEAVRIWRDWAAGVGENVTSVVRFLRPPDIPDVPEPLRNTPLLTIDGACIGSREEGEGAFAPLLEIGEPIMNTFDQVPPAALCRIHMDPEQPVPGLGHHRVLRELPDEAIEVFASMSGADSGTPLLLTEIRHMGGALSRPAESGGALSHLDAHFAMFGIGMPMTPELGQAIEAHHDRLHDAMESWAADGGYFNFAERPCDANAILPADVCARLGEVKRQYDPDGRIVGSHAVSLDPAA